MDTNLDRRRFIGQATAVLAGAAATAAWAQPAPAPAVARAVKVIGVCCSPRKGKTTSSALEAALEAARSVDAAVQTELVELADLRIMGPTGGPPAQGEADDFPALAEKLADASVGGIIVGTPVYMAGVTTLCKAFLDRCVMFRRNFALRDKVAGALAVGGVRNGGQELAVAGVITALLCQDMIVVGDGRPTAHMGATLLNDGKDNITNDEFGLTTARGLGRRVAEVALRLAK